MNKKGFTLIELLAIIIIIGIIATISIVSISSNINRSKNSSVVDLGKNYVESVRAMRAQDKLFYEPKSGEVLLIPYSEINGVEISNGDTTGYGKILPTYSFVGLENKQNKHVYYINQVDEAFRILDRKDSNSVSNDDIAVDEDLSNYKEIKTPLSSFNITYGANNYSIKSVGVAFDANYVRNGNTKYTTAFDLAYLEINFKGTLTIYDWTSNSSSNKRIELEIVKNEIGELDNKTYTFKRKSGSEGYGYLGEWKAVDGSGEPLIVNGKELIIQVNALTDEGLNFSLLVGSKRVYESVETTKNATLYGFFTKDNSYYLSNSQIKNTISAYDYFAQYGKFQSTNNNIVSIDGTNYSLTGSKILYIVAITR